MNSIKTAVVTTVLLVVVYAVYTAINNGPGLNSSSDNADGFRTDPSAPGKSNSPLWGKGGTLAGNRSKAARDSGSSRAPLDVTASIPGEPAAGSRSGVSGLPLRSSSPRGSTEDAADRGGRTNQVADASKDRLPGSGRDLDRQPPRSEPAPGASSAAGADPSRSANGEVRQQFRAMMDDAVRRLEGGEKAWAGVLQELSRLYGNPGFSPEESRQLAELLDQLAGTIIYSRRHILEPPYTVQSGETLAQIAQRYNVPWQLLAKINGLRDPERLAPGKQLKVLRGPFDAEVHLDRYELVLFLSGCYAGHFPIGVGRDQPKLEGRYRVKKKLADRPYYGPDRIIEAKDPQNPLGKRWIELDEQIGIHGTNDPRNLRRADGRGTICLADKDIDDIYDILSPESQASRGSQVTIQR